MQLVLLSHRLRPLKAPKGSERLAGWRSGRAVPAGVQAAEEVSEPVDHGLVVGNVQEVARGRFQSRGEAVELASIDMLGFMRPMMPVDGGMEPTLAGR